jgi:hypothetical protein
MLDEAVRAAVGVPEPHLRAPLLARISALHQDGDSELAAREAGDAPALAEAIDDPYARSFALAKLSEGLATANPR